jgi:ribonuclease Z
VRLRFALFFRALCADWPHEILQYPIVIVECSFLFDEHIEAANSTLHTHWKDLKGYVLKNPKVTFVLIHFSLRYQTKQIMDFFEKEKKENGFNNIIVWLDEIVESQ